MNVFTHALLPVLVVRVARAARHRTRAEWIAIGVAGALPDLLNPHLTLDQRMQSWSHGLPFFGCVCGILMLVCVLSRGRMSAGFGGLLCGAYGLHLVCDAISGGINWLHPVGKFVWHDDFLVHPVWWIPLDIACFLALYYLFRLRPLLQRLRRHREDSAMREPPCAAGTAGDGASKKVPGS